MSYQQITISSVNPNDTTGGGGCICDPRRQEDCKPPYAVFHGNDMYDFRSPHPVLCESCLKHALAKMRDEEPLEAGERGSVVEASAPTFREQPESPIIEDDTPDI